jgi:hypothetical protein
MRLLRLHPRLTCGQSYSTPPLLTYPIKSIHPFTPRHSHRLSQLHISTFPIASPTPTTVHVLLTDSGYSSKHEASEREAGPDLMASNSPSEDISDNQMLESQPLQKRRRVTRACDECRRKKIKYDGRYPCTYCTVYSYGMSTTSHLTS